MNSINPAIRKQISQQYRHMEEKRNGGRPAPIGFRICNRCRVAYDKEIMKPVKYRNGKTVYYCPVCNERRR